VHGFGSVEELAGGPTDCDGEGWVFSCQELLLENFNCTYGGTEKS
jgi:hypothetical protein